ncbi:hypothetical protein RFI_21537, partial [Reticulomyxa filosa]
MEQTRYPNDDTMMDDNDTIEMEQMELDLEKQMAEDRRRRHNRKQRQLQKEKESESKGRYWKAPKPQAEYRPTRLRGQMEHDKNNYHGDLMQVASKLLAQEEEKNKTWGAMIHDKTKYIPHQHQQHINDNINDNINNKIKKDNKKTKRQGTKRTWLEHVEELNAIPLSSQKYSSPRTVRQSQDVQGANEHVPWVEAVEKKIAQWQEHYYGSDIDSNDDNRNTPPPLLTQPNPEAFHPSTPHHPAVDGANHISPFKSAWNRARRKGYVNPRVADGIMHMVEQLRNDIEGYYNKRTAFDSDKPIDPTDFGIESIHNLAGVNVLTADQTINARVVHMTKYKMYDLYWTICVSNELSNVIRQTSCKHFSLILRSRLVEKRRLRVSDFIRIFPPYTCMFIAGDHNPQSERIPLPLLSNAFYTVASSEVTSSISDYDAFPLTLEPELWNKFECVNLESIESALSNDLGLNIMMDALARDKTTLNNNGDGNDGIDIAPIMSKEMEQDRIANVPMEISDPLDVDSWDCSNIISQLTHLQLDANVISQPQTIHLWGL